MADNITAPATGVVLATKDVGGVQYPRNLLSTVDGSDVADSNPLPVKISGTMAVSGTFYQATQPVSLASAPLPAGAATAAKQDAIISAISDADYYPATQMVSATALPLPDGAATEATLAATASADRVFAITPSDSTALATIPKALLVTAPGNLAVRGTDVTPVTIPVLAGQVLPIRARYVNATGTTASVVGLA